MDKTKAILSLCRRDLIDIYKHVVDNIKPEELVKNHIAFCDDGIIIKNKAQHSATITRHEIDRTNIHVIGGGKCVLGMASAIGSLAIEAGLQYKFSNGSISLPLGMKTSLNNEIRTRLEAIKVNCSFGSMNNLPDDESVKATDNIIANINSTLLDDAEQDCNSLFIVLISGGGSACLSSPKYVTLEEKLHIIQGLVQKGADIKELNAVRRCLSNVKGGNLARHIFRANPRSRIISLVISDVIGDSLEYIASGPTYIDDRISDFQRWESMTAILHRYDLEGLIKIGLPNQSPPLDKQICGNQLHNIILGNNRIALEHASHKAEQLGYEVIVIAEPLDGTTEEAMSKLMSFSRATVSSPDKKILILAGGETTVRRGEGESWGIGGRLQEFCLDYIIHKITHNDSENCSLDLLLAASTDGQDGPTDVAACFASKVELDICMNEGESPMKLDIVDLLSFKRRHDSNTLWSTHRPDWLLKTGSTGTNVMDLFMYVKVR